MRHGTAGRRSRNRGHGNRGGGGGSHGGYNNNRGQVFDSNGPDVRIRGTAYQILEKYQTLARDAASLGDRVLSESYLQHAEHYQRLVNSYAPAPQEQRDAAFGGSHQQQSQDVTATSTMDVRAPAEAGGEDLGLPQSILGQPRQVVSQVQEFADA